jgi:hypothetical protein
MKSLKAAVGGFFGSEYTVDIDFDQLSIQYTQKVYQADQKLWDAMVADITMDENTKIDLLTAFDELNLVYWKGWYLPEENIFDGTTWQVKLGFDEFEKVSYGENAYPEEWFGFCQLLEKITGEKFR